MACTCGSMSEYVWLHALIVLLDLDLDLDLDWCLNACHIMHSPLTSCPAPSQTYNASRALVRGEVEGSTSAPSSVNLEGVMR